VLFSKNPIFSYRPSDSNFDRECIPIVPRRGPISGNATGSLPSRLVWCPAGGSCRPACVAQRNRRPRNNVRVLCYLLPAARTSLFLPSARAGRRIECFLLCLAEAVTDRQDSRSACRLLTIVSRPTASSSTGSFEMHYNRK